MPKFKQRCLFEGIKDKEIVEVSKTSTLKPTFFSEGVIFDGLQTEVINTSENDISENKYNIISADENKIQKINVLSLFDGISCARVALERANILVGSYFASEIDKYAIQISKKNYPDIIHVGDITKLKYENGKLISKDEKYPGEYEIKFDLIIGGSPCQDLSIAKRNREGLKGSRSGLFWEYVRLLNEVKPKFFILENVNSMPKEAKETISRALFGCLGEDWERIDKD
jgi:hypothetical protein